MKHLNMLLFFLFSHAHSSVFNTLLEKYPHSFLINFDKGYAIYQLMKDVHDLLTHFKINYWIQGGTLLGALRHGGLMWWDDDLDINIDKDDFICLIKLRPLLEQLGYILVFTDIPSQFYITTQKYSYNAPVLDIFLTRREHNTTRYILHDWTRNKEAIYMYDYELYPLQLYTFGEFKVYGPYDPYVYLQCGFGNNYMNNVTLYNHHLYMEGCKEHYHCSLEDIPAQYRNCVPLYKPLQNRVKELLEEQSSSTHKINT